MGVKLDSGALSSRIILDPFETDGKRTPKIALDTVHVPAD